MKSNVVKIHLGTIVFHKNHKDRIHVIDIVEIGYL